MRSSSPPPGGRSGGKKPYRPGGPRPATPRPPEDKRPRGRDDRRDGKPREDKAAAPETRPEARTDSRPDTRPARTPERPVLSLAPRQTERPQAPAERPEGGAPHGKRRSFQAIRPARNDAPRPDPDQPRGTLWLYGLHPVAAALRNPQRRLRRLLLTPEAEAALSAVVPKPWPISSETVDRARLDQLLGRDAVAQGVALLADPLASPSLQQALERPGPVLVLDQVSDPRNVGAILRSAQAMGACCVITQDRNSPDETGALAKAAAGALERIPLLRAVNIARTLVALKAAGCWTVGLDAAGQPLSGKALSGRRVALVLGSEGEGMRRLTRETCDELAGIPMPGGGSAIDSLNVSAAATVALYELSRLG